MTMNEDFIKFANSFQVVAHLELEGISSLLEFLGNPQDDLKCFHVAGTNGKGSVCAFLAKILTNAGYKTGKFISPNMVDVTERISVDGKDITAQEFSALSEEIKIASEKVKEKLGVYPTQFELWTAAAFIYFKREKCDYCVIEVGMGGEKDATNVIKSPVASIITSISTDHTEYLGSTISEIAAAKAGIIKKGRPLITFNQPREVMDVFEKKIRQVEAGKLIIAKSPTLCKPTMGHEVICYNGISEAMLGICGIYQPQNASLAIEAARLLNIDETYIKRGLFEARNIGRFDLKEESTEHTLIIDGAHNGDGMNSLMRSLERYFPNEKPIFIMGMMKDKEKNGVISSMKNSSSCPSEIFTVTVKDNPRAADAISLSKLFSEKGIPSLPFSSLGAALEKARTTNAKILVICGSLYLYKDYHEYCES